MLPTTSVLGLGWLLVQVRASLGLARTALKDPAISRVSAPPSKGLPTAWA